MWTIIYSWKVIRFTFQFCQQHYSVELKDNSVELTEEGILLAEMALETKDLWDENDPWARWIWMFLLAFLMDLRWKWGENAIILSFFPLKYLFSYQPLHKNLQTHIVVSGNICLKYFKSLSIVQFIFINSFNGLSVSTLLVYFYGSLLGEWHIRSMLFHFLFQLSSKKNIADLWWML